MQATGVSHIAICVSDMDRSLTFYRDQLGMTVIIDHATDPTEGGRGHNYKHQRKTRRRVSIGYPGDNVPALTLTSHPGEAPDGESIQLDQVGITHLAFIMPDLKAFTEAILAKGVELAGPREAFFDPQGNVRNIYVKDPDGILIQFSAGGGG